MAGTGAGVVAGTLLVPAAAAGVDTAASCSTLLLLLLLGLLETAADRGQTLPKTILLAGLLACLPMVVEGRGVCGGRVVSVQKEEKGELW